MTMGKMNKKKIEAILQLYKKISYYRELSIAMSNAILNMSDNYEKFFGPDFTVHHRELEDVEASLCRVTTIIELMNKDGIIDGNVMLEACKINTPKIQAEFEKGFKRKRGELYEFYGKQDDE